MIIFDHVYKQYGNKVVLNDINLAIEGGEFVTITGVSGAGKTTLINTLIGAEKIDTGSISVDGYEVTSMSPSVRQLYRRKIGVIFQDYKLLPKKTVCENTAFAMEVCGNSDEEIKLRVPEVLEVVGLTEQKNLFPHQLSGGEKQRAAIARALAHNPKLIIADEPTGNLDPKNTKEIIELLLKIHQSGITVILASHDKEMIDMIGKRVVRLNHGIIIFDRAESGYDIEEETIVETEIRVKKMYIE